MENFTDTHDKNLVLKQELLERGLYVQTIGYPDEINYLVVSCMPPKDGLPIDHNAN